MPNVHNTLASLFYDIADAIRAKTGNSGDIVADEFPDAIADIETGITPSGKITITANADNIDVTQYALADVQVPTTVKTFSTFDNGVETEHAYITTEDTGTSINIITQRVKEVS